MKINQADLEYAYKYPFSLEAKRLAQEIGSEKVEERYLSAGKLRVEEALKNSRIDFTAAASEELRIKYLVSYIYARMLISAPAPHLWKFLSQVQARLQP